jgi:hypothetical protein
VVDGLHQSNVVALALSFEAIANMDDDYLAIIDAAVPGHGLALGNHAERHLRSMLPAQRWSGIPAMFLPTLEVA